jgi:hypothetical protein
MVLTAGIFACQFAWCLDGEKENSAQKQPARTYAKTRIYLLHGQSNMDGRADKRMYLKMAPGNNFAVPNNVECWTYARERTADGRKDTPIPLTMGDGRMFGVELTLARSLARAYPDDRIVLVKSAAGGTCIAQWMPGGALFRSIVEGARQARLRYDNTVVCAFAWLQGESDGGSQAAAELYGQKFSVLMAAVREKIKEPNLPVLLLVPYVAENNKAHGIYNAIVREKQMDVARKVNNVHTLDTKEVNPNGLVHYSVQGYLDLGRLMAGKLVAIERERVDFRGKDDGRPGNP